MKNSNLRRGGGTETAGPLDTRRLAHALRMPGIDPRHWLSYGTVATLNADGTVDFEDEHAVFVGPEGCTVDVLLMPSNQHVSCRYSGVQGGSAGSIYTPVRPGDEVVVAIPDGDLRLPPVVVCVMTGEHSPLPLGDDRTPIWKNDRILINGAFGVPVQIRSTDSGAEILLSPDSKITLTADTVLVGGSDASEPIPLGATLQKLLDAIQTHTHPGVTVGSGVTGTSTELQDPLLTWETRSHNGKVK